MRTRRSSAPGFSLVELLMAMTLFSALSVGLIALLARTSDFLSTGSSQTETLDSLQSFAEQFGADVATVASRADCDTGRPDVRLYSDTIGVDLDGDKRPDVRAQRFFFVRTVTDDATDSDRRKAGTVPGAKDVMDQIGVDRKKAAEHKLRASGGLMEVLWTALPAGMKQETKQPDAVMSIYRATRSPPGGASTLFPSKSWGDRQAQQTDKGPGSLTDLRASGAKPVLNGVLYFGVEFWGRKTTTWDPLTKPRDGGPLATWDSTRGIMPPGDGSDGDSFFLSKADKDKGTIDDPTDDTFPRRLRVTCVVEELGKRAKTGQLQADLAADPRGGRIEVDDAKFIPLTDTANRYVKIDGEWMEIGQPEGASIPVLHRGVRGTLPAKHTTGATVHYGRTLVLEYDIPTFRDTYRDELPSSTGRTGPGK